MVSILANNTLVKYGSENRYVEGDEDAAAVSSDAFNFINAIFDSEPEYDMTWSFNNDRFDVKVYTRHVAESKIELTYSIMQVERQAAEVFALARRRLNFVRNGGGAHSGRRYEEACEFPAATNGPGDRCLVTRAASREGLVRPGPGGSCTPPTPGRARCSPRPAASSGRRAASRRGSWRGGCCRCPGTRCAPGKSAGSG